MQVSRKTGIAALTVGAAAIALTIAPQGAGAADLTQLHVVKTFPTNVIAPLQFAVDGKRIFVADSFTGTLSKIGSSTPVVQAPEGTEIAGVAVDPTTHDIAYTTTNSDHSVTTLTIKSKSGAPVVADLSGFERKNNPDHAIQYGVVGSTSNCAKQALKAAGIPVRYKGQYDSHPYSAVSLGHGNWAVADAGGNDIVKVDAAGNVSLLSLLPAQILTVSADFAAQNGLPKCTVGVQYGFEAVPTDVEVGPHGGLYASTLPGGEGVAGSVYRIHPGADPVQIATGFAGATNLAISPSGTIYVAELFSGTISVIAHHAGVPVASLPAVSAVEYANGHLYASTAPAALLEDDGPSGPSGPSGPPPAGSVVELG